MKGQKVLALSLIALAVGQAAYAADNDDAETLGDVVVSASKIEQSISEAPANVSVITAKKIENMGATRVGDALVAKVPSLYLRGSALGTTKRHGTGTQGISLRGVPGNKTLVLIDGQDARERGNGGAMNWSSIFVDDIERVEVVPGVSSSLHGSDAIGGVISIISKTPTKREITAKASRGFSDGDRSAFEAMYRDRLENGFGMVLGFSYQDIGGYPSDFVSKAPVGAGGTIVTGAQQVVTNLGATSYIVGDKGDTPSRAVNATAKFYYDLSPTSKLHAGYAYNDAFSGNKPFNSYLKNAAGATVFTGAVNINGLRTTLTESNFLTATPSDYSGNRYFAGYEGEVLGNYKLKVDVGYYAQESYYDAAGAAATYNGGAGKKTSVPSSNLDGSAQLSFPIGDRHFVVAGVSTLRAELNRKYYDLSNWRDPNSVTILNDRSDGVSSTNSLFLQDQIELGAVTVYAGGRYDAWSTHGSTQQFIAPVTLQINPERSVSAFSPKLSAVYKINDQFTLRGSAGKAFRAPNNSDLYTRSVQPLVNGSTNTLITEADPNLKPETAQSWEIGGEMSFAEGGNLKAAYYDTKLSDLIYRVDVTPNVLRRQVNVGSAVSRGVELSGEMPVSSWLSVNGSYSYTYAVITNTADPLSVGKRMTGVPRNMASFGVDIKQGAWSGTISSRFIGETFSNSQNLDVVKDVFGGYSKYWLTDVKVNYAIQKNLKASFVVNNLMDRTYYDYYLMPGRNLGIELTASY